MQGSLGAKPDLASPCQRDAGDSLACLAAEDTKVLYSNGDQVLCLKKRAHFSGQRDVSQIGRLEDQYNKCELSGS